MKKLYSRSTLKKWISLGVFILLIGASNFVQAQDNSLNCNTPQGDPAKIYAHYVGTNPYSANCDYSVVKWYRNNIEVYSQSIDVAAFGSFQADYIVNCSDLSPLVPVNIKVSCTHYYRVCGFNHTFNLTNSVNYDVPLSPRARFPVFSEGVTDGLYGDRIIVTWSIDEHFDNHSYIVYRNGVNVSGTLPAGTRSFTHSGLAPGTSGNYTVQGVVNGSLIPNSTPSLLGSTFNINLHASNSNSDRITLTWEDFRNTNAASGHIINRWDGANNIEIFNNASITSASYEDISTTLIPGYLYRYIIRTQPLSNNITDTAYGKKTPNGIISGTVKTPAPSLIGVPNIQIVAKLKGASLPTDATTTYTATTNSNGEYTINNVYYYTGASFDVYPVYPGRIYSPDTTAVTLNSTNSSAPNTNFTDLSSFVVSGTITQNGCPMKGIQLWRGTDSTGVVTDSMGVYHLTVSTGGTYTIKPKLADHKFSPSQSVVNVVADMSNIDFADTTKYLLVGHFWASCETKFGQATIRISDISSDCYVDTLITDANGYYSSILPARKYKMDLIGFISDDENIVSSLNVSAYFANQRTIDLTTIDSNSFNGDTLTNNYIYRIKPELTITGIDQATTCSGEVLPILEQRRPCLLKLMAKESFNGIQCFADTGYVIIKENISSNGIMTNTDTLFYSKGDTIKYTLKPGTPNIIAPYKKFLQAILYRDGQTDTVRYDVIVTGHRPRTQTFTTVTPSMPFHILHNPPGDASYSYLDVNSSISNSFTTSFLQEGSVNGYISAHLGVDQSISVGLGAEVEYAIDATADYTASLGSGVSGLTNDSYNITTTANERFETSGNTDIIGGAGDVYVGGALNMIYALSDALLYDFNTCSISNSVVLMMQPDGIATTFMYTESHITDVIIPELQNITNLYIQQGKPDSAAFYQNQLHVWEQVVANNHANIDSAGFIENKTFSGGVSYENSVETTRSNSHSLEMNYYLDYGVAVDLGVTVAGIGITGGVAVQGRSTWGNVAASETSTTTTVGYVLSDDDMGDSYSVNIANDSVYGTPVFRLVAGRSSCPWEVGTLPREGVQMLSNSTFQEVREDQQAVYVLQLANMSESDEEMTYHLIFDHTSNPDGAVLTIGGSPVVGNVPYPYTIPAGGSVNATITVSKGPIAELYNDLKFTLKSSCDDEISQDVYLDAKFYKEFDLTVAKMGQGTTYPAVGTTQVKEGNSVYLYASPASGYVFEKWIVGTTTYTDPSILITMTAATTATAYFIVTTAQQYSLQMTHSGNGSTIPPTGTHFYNEGTIVDLSATPNMQNAFVKWIVNGEEINDSQTEITMNANTTVEAYFVETKNLAIQIQGNGTTDPSVGSHTYNVGSTINLFASPSAGYIFQKWIVGSTELFTQSIQLNLTTDTNVTAVFVATAEDQFNLTLSSNGNGTTTPPSGTHLYVDGSIVALTANPNNGNVFVKWVINGIETTSNPVNMNITGNATVVAHFTETKTLTVVVQGNGSTTPAIGANPYPIGTIVNLYASPDLGSVFQKWIIGSTELFTQAVQIDLTTDTNATAVFVQQFTMAISSNGNGTTTPPAGFHLFLDGSVVALTAVPESNNAFVKWVINGVDNTNNPTNTTITANSTVVAHFQSTYGIAQNNAENGFSRVFPNPSNGNIQFETSAIIESIDVLDVMGKIVYSCKNVNNTNFTLNLTHLNPGVYMVRLYDKSNLSTQKIQIIK